MRTVTLGIDARPPAATLTAGAWGAAATRAGVGQRIDALAAAARSTGAAGVAARAAMVGVAGPTDARAVAAVELG